MNLTLLKDFFAYSGKKQKQLEFCRSRITQKVNTHSLFLALFSKPSPVLTISLLVDFMHTFHPQLQQLSQNFVNQYSSYKFLSTKQPYTIQQIVQKASQIMTKEWGKNNQINFQQFSLLVRGKIDLPKKQKQLQFKHKKALFDLLEKEMQNLLDLQLFKKALTLQYTNIVDLFETITASNKITKNDVKNLFLLHQERLEDQDLDLIQKRVKLPLSFQEFLSLFKQKPQPLKHKQIKIYHTSKKSQNKNWLGSSYKETKFQTPKGKLSNNVQTTALTKIIRQDLKRSDIRISQFTLKQTGQAKPNYLILGQILRIEEQYNKKKRDLVMRQDCDLQLVYERFGENFQDILNKCYGVCNFSAFVRFLVPHDMQHKYLSFIRYKSDNQISQIIQMEIYEILQRWHKKQDEIQNLWKNNDRQMIFRGFCVPSKDQFNTQQLNKMFTNREKQILLDRMDPHRSGFVKVEYFK